MKREDLIIRHRKNTESVLDDGEIDRFLEQMKKLFEQGVA
jgi:hypothetical protein